MTAGNVTPAERRTGKGVQNEHSLSVEAPRAGVWRSDMTSSREGPLTLRTHAAGGLKIAEALHSASLHPEGIDIGAVGSPDIGGIGNSDTLWRPLAGYRGASGGVHNLDALRCQGGNTLNTVEGIGRSHQSQASFHPIHGRAIMPFGGVWSRDRAPGVPCRAAPPHLHGKHGGGVGMAKSSNQKSIAEVLAAELVNAFGLDLMQDIAGHIPGRGRGRPRKPRDDEFRRVCFLYVTEPGLMFATAAKRVYATKSGGAGMSEEGFADTMRKKKDAALGANPNFFRDEARRIANEGLGEVRADEFPQIAQQQQSAKEVRELFAKTRLDLAAVSGVGEGLSRSVADLGRLSIGPAMPPGLFEEICRMVNFDDAFSDLISDETPADSLARVYWLVRKLMEAWSGNNI